MHYSVFECLLDAQGLRRMKAAVKRVIRPKADRVRFYYLCSSCVARTEVTSGAEVLVERDGPVIV